ncbi:shikimate 5-dehydrogenase, partial [Pasteurella multocida subsp. gallicida str. Anand1_poultry]
YPESLIEQASSIFDVVALPAETPLIQYAKQQNKQTISGAEVIVLQAVEQFELYTHQRPSETLIAEAAEFARFNPLILHSDSIGHSIVPFLC